MLMENKIISENIIPKELIDELYNIFVTLCHDDRFKIIPSNFIEVFHNISEKRNLNIDKDIWTQIFFQIDSDMDGAISFQDFLKFMYSNLKIVLGETGEKLSICKFK
jgi:Ca2+-binding EF-hand superfamily protein